MIWGQRLLLAFLHFVELSQNIVLTIFQMLDFCVIIVVRIDSLSLCVVCFMEAYVFLLFSVFG